MEDNLLQTNPYVYTLFTKTFSDNDNYVYGINKVFIKISNISNIDGFNLNEQLKVFKKCK
jgi:hypothetical protein